MNKEVLLEISSLSQIYNSQIILKNINAKFYSGTINLITGNNGSGKSTLLKLIAGLIKPVMGKITRNFSEPPRYLGHDNFVYSQLTPMENLIFWCKVSGIKPDLQKITETLENLGLKHFLSEKSAIFSRGMLQKLNIGRVLLGSAPVILLDEPFTGLDQSAQDYLKNLLLKWKNDGLCIIMVSHTHLENPELAENRYSISNYSLNAIS